MSLEHPVRPEKDVLKKKKKMIAHHRDAGATLKGVSLAKAEAI